MSAFRVVTAAVAALTAAGSLAACSSSGGSSGGGGGSEYVIGATEDLSGPVAAYGKWVQQSWTAYFDAVNAKGGINGKKVKLMILDDASDPTKAAANVRQLITSDHAILVSGSTLSNICSALAPIVKRDSVPMLCTAVTADVMSPVQKFVFSRLVPEQTVASPVVQFASTVVTKSKPKIGIVVADGAGAVAFGKAVSAAAKAKGWDVVADQIVPTAGSGNLTGPAAKVAAAKPDMVITELTPPLQISLNHALRTDGMTGPILGETADYATLAALADPNYYQFWQRDVVDASSSGQAVKDFVAAMKTQGVSGTEGLNTGKIVEDYLAASAVGQALKTCGTSCSGSDLAAALAKTKLNLSGISSSWGYSSSSHLPVTQISVYKWDAATKTAVQSGSPLPLGGL